MLVITNYKYRYSPFILKKKTYTMHRIIFLWKIHTNVPTSSKSISQDKKVKASLS